jgi:glucose/arabinose dehydrogenase
MHDRSRSLIAYFRILVCSCCAASLIHAQPAIAPSNVLLQAGYSISALATNLDFPTALTTSLDTIWVAEAGFLPGSVPKVKTISSSNVIATVLSGDMLPPGKFLGPLTDIVFHDGWLWIAHRQVGANGWTVGAISKFEPADATGTFTTVITNLPSAGDHYTEQIIFGPDNRAYFAQGSATNSSVVGADDGWPSLFPTFRDYAPVNIELSGSSWKTAVPFDLDPNASKFTSPYQPFGVTAAPSTLVPAATPATPRDGMIAGNGTVYSFNPNVPDPASTLRLEGWGFRNPYGIGLDPMNPGHLFVTNNGSDQRSRLAGSTLPQIIESRPINRDYDDLFVIDLTDSTQEFFGWPDYFHNPATGAVVPVSDQFFCVADTSFPCPIPFAFSDSFRANLKVEPAVAEFADHSSANKFDFSDSQFGFAGDIFVAETGSLPPFTGAAVLSGYKVVRVSRASGKVQDFITHTSPEDPDSVFQSNGFNKPIDVKFNRGRMLITDLGVIEPSIGRVEPGTGKIWVVIPASTR